MPMKPKTRVMAVTTILAVSIGFGALFIYIEEKKYEALYYKSELEKHEQQAGFSVLMQQLAKRGDNPSLKTLLESKSIQALSAQQAQQVINAITQNKTAPVQLTEAEVEAIKVLLSD